MLSQEGASFSRGFFAQSLLPSPFHLIPRTVSHPPPCLHPTIVTRLKRDSTSPPPPMSNLHHSPPFLASTCLLYGVIIASLLSTAWPAGHRVSRVPPSSPLAPLLSPSAYPGHSGLPSWAFVATSFLDESKWIPFTARLLLPAGPSPRTQGQNISYQNGPQPALTLPHPRWGLSSSSNPQSNLDPESEIPIPSFVAACRSSAAFCTCAS